MTSWLFKYSQYWKTQPTSSNYVEKTFVHEVSESDEENMRLLLKKKKSLSLIKLKGSFIFFYFFIILSFQISLYVADWIIFLRTGKNCSLSVRLDWQAEKLVSSPEY
jgi:hypothetical protein